MQPLMYETVKAEKEKYLLISFFHFYWLLFLWLQVKTGWAPSDQESLD